MKLVFPKIEHKQPTLDYCLEHIQNNETLINGSAGLLEYADYENYEAWLEMVEKTQTEASDGWVTHSVFFAMIEDRIIGTVAIRHYLNDELLQEGGHIGFGVRPSERRKGYGSKMLALALKKCKELGIEKALITCDKSNIASAKTIEANGGVFENEIVEEDGNIVRRYWISI